MRIFLQESGVISKNDCWVCICEGYMYIEERLEDLIRVLNTEWKLDKHLVG